MSFTPATIFPLFFANNLEGQTYGVELSAKYQLLDWWRLHAGYDLLKEHLHVKQGQVDLNNSLNETSDPQHQFFRDVVTQIYVHNIKQAVPFRAFGISARLGLRRCAQVCNDQVLGN